MLCGVKRCRSFSCSPHGHDQRTLRLIDIGCGTGRFLELVKQAWPRLPSLGLDLSEPYIRHARRYLGRWSRLDLVVANAEAIPAPDNSVDAVTSISWSTNYRQRCAELSLGSASVC